MLCLRKRESAEPEFFSSAFILSFLTRKHELFFQLCSCNLIFNDEDAFNCHARTGNPVTTIQAGGNIRIPEAALQCSARVVCQKCQRRYRKLKGYKGRSKTIVT